MKLTPDEILQIIQKANRLRSDDFTQDCYLAVLEQGAATEEQIKAVCAKVDRQHRDARIREKHSTAPHVYDENGVCRDEEVYFGSTEEESVGTFVGEAEKSAVAKMGKAVLLCNALFCSFMQKQNPQRIYKKNKIYKSKRSDLDFFKENTNNRRLIRNYLFEFYPCRSSCKVFPRRTIANFFINNRRKQDV